MSKRDPRVDDYIAKAADFAQPILKHIRTVIHQGCPQVEETIKWGFPHFVYKGVLCNMASFKAHCAFGFWKGDLLFRGNHSVQKKAAEAMGHFGRITTLADLPSKDTLLSYIKEAARLNEEGVKRPTKPKSKQKKPLEIPGYVTSALAANRRARETFEQFSDSHKREYVEWITDAKGEDTRNRRLETALRWMAEGKSRSWKYARC